MVYKESGNSSVSWHSEGTWVGGEQWPRVDHRAQNCALESQIHPRTRMWKVTFIKAKRNAFLIGILNISKTLNSSLRTLPFSLICLTCEYSIFEMKSFRVISFRNLLMKPFDRSQIYVISTALFPSLETFPRSAVPQRGLLMEFFQFSGETEKRWLPYTFLGDSPMHITY